jgi:hypothetical protein
MDEHKVCNGKRTSPATVVNGTRVTVAFPFSKLVSQEPSGDLRAVAMLVAELSDVVADLAENEVTTDLRRRAAALRDQLTNSVPTRG